MKRNVKGFTLIELLVVVVIIAVLGGFLLSAIFGVQDTANNLTTANTLKLVRSALSDYKSGTGSFPIMDGCADAKTAISPVGGWGYVLQTEGPDAPYIKDSADLVERNVDDKTALIYDAWNNPIHFRVVGSVGAANATIGADDYFRVGSLLGVFYVWSDGANGVPEFNQAYTNCPEPFTDWDLDLTTASNWQTFELVDDALFDEYVDDDVIVSGQAK